MFDTIHLQLYRDENNTNSERIAENLSNVSEHYYKDTPIFTGYLKNLFVSISDTKVIVKNGSLCKFYNGNNYVPIGRKDTLQAVQMISDSLHIQMLKAIVTRLDVANTLLLNYPPFVYLEHLGTLARYERLRQPNSIYYKQKSGRSLVLYDKNQEQREQGIIIPGKYQGKNVLRIEQRFQGRVSALMHTPRLTIGTLCEEHTYNAVLANWKDTIKTIKPIAESNITFNAPMKGKKQLLHILGIQALAEKLGGQSALLSLLKQEQRVGNLTKKQAYDLKQEIVKATAEQLGTPAIHDCNTELILEVENAVKKY